MKKILLFATLVACSLMFFSCEKKTTLDPNQDAIARVKSEVIGSSWKGNLVTILGDKGDEAIVTFTETKVSSKFEKETVTANILAWKCVDGKEVWLELDDEQKTNLTIKEVVGDNMKLGFDSTWGMNVFPMELTRVK
ncbi:MAG: hypothetical protein IJU36_04550 [Paludibacteraceae bacterium]|nr:hypothetical protein [Paludibacteraceae bacterium]